MQHLSIPTCFFPSTTLFIDDCRDFLLSLVLQLDEKLAYRIYDSPIDALDDINQDRCELEQLNRRCLMEYSEAKNCPVSQEHMNHDLAAIHAEVYNPHRFSEISVVVVDCSMPEMDGLELCRRINNPNIKKILLTGKSNEHIAKEAMKEGLIHRYIKKTEANIASVISKTIYELQLEYFLAMSEMAVRMISIQPPACLSDSQFTDFFQELCQSKGIVEYYLADDSGSLLMLDEDASVSFLIVRTTEDLRKYYDFGRANGFSEDELRQISSGEKIPCLWTETASGIQWNQWSSFLVPAQQFISNETYYYAYVQGPALFDLRQEKILSLHRYLEGLDTEELLEV